MNEFYRRHGGRQRGNKQIYENIYKFSCQFRGCKWNVLMCFWVGKEYQLQKEVNLAAINIHLTKNHISETFHTILEPPVYIVFYLSHYHRGYVYSYINKVTIFKLTAQLKKRF